ncbi:MAG: carbohydrate-binding protein CenC, partial [Clostridiaceae bacterium]|nr:carbohydrate-binding protein CenC [Clostridiaceae bacterium]
ILAFVAGCLMLMSVFMSTPIQVSAQATGVPGKPSLTVLDNYGMITPKMWVLSGSNNATKWRLYENNKLIQCGTAVDKTPNGQIITPDTFIRPAGQYKYKCEFINKYGSSFSDEITLSVNHGFVDSVPQAIFTEKFENGTNGWTTSSTSTGSTAVIESGTGTYGSKCVKITSPSVAADIAYKKQVTGLKAGDKYRLTAYVKYKNVVKGAGSDDWLSIGANICIFDTWTYSSQWQNLGTFYPGWQKITFDFTPESSSVNIAVRLGFKTSKVTGTAWFDDITIEHLPKQVFTETFENGLSTDWKIRSSKNNPDLVEKGIVSGGVNNTKCLRISATNEDIDYGLYRTLNLTPDAYYKFSAYMKYQNVTVSYKGADGNTHNKKDGANICIFNNLGEGAIWNRTFTATGTNTTWKEVNLIFKAPESGEANIGLRLGFYNCETKGTVWFDNIKVEPVSSDYVYESEHINAYFDASDTKNTTRSAVIKWLSDMDKVYLLMKEFSGNRTPFGGNKVGLLSTNAAPEGAACAGNPIFWFKGSSENPVEGQLTRTSKTNDLSFAILHEMGHNFNYIGNYNWNWNWNDEMFANFRAYYAVEQLEKMYSNQIGSRPVVFDPSNTYRYGDELKNYYLKRYNETMANGYYHHDGLGYLLIKAKELVGWDPIIETMVELSNTNSSGKNDYEKLFNFYTILSQKSNKPINSLIPLADMKAVQTFYATYKTLSDYPENYPPKN